MLLRYSLTLFTINMINKIKLTHNFTAEGYVSFPTNKLLETKSLVKRLKISALNSIDLFLSKIGVNLSPR